MEQPTPLPRPTPLDLQSEPVVFPSESEEVIEDPGTAHGLTFGGGIYLLQPNWGSNPAYHVTTITKTKGFSLFTRTYQDFRYDLQAAPLAWFGFYNENGLGGRLRWFLFEASSREGVIVTPDSTVRTARPLGLILESGVVGDEFRFLSNLKLHVWDLEGTRSWNGDNWQLQAAAGVRYAHLSQDYLAMLRPGPGSPTEPKDLRFSHNFNGAGPTLAVEGKYCLGCSGLALYGNGRGAILFGTGKEQLLQTSTNSVHDHRRQQADVLPVSELEVGVQFTRCAFHGLLFIQTGFVGQVWWGAGNASHSDRNDDTNLGFVGLVVRAGVNF
jgi:hypothetical protein